jgi:metal-responsive CopG/Arc/MetJ family transcriptional regulator
MMTIQVVLDKELLTETDRAAKQSKQNRSALVRDALRGHLQTMKVRALEAKENAAYIKHPDRDEDWGVWEAEAAWPPE